MSKQNTRNVVYTDTYNLSLPAWRVTIKELTVRSAQRVILFEKYILAFLQNGVPAKDLEELNSKLSFALNIKESFVADFIKRLDTMDLLINKKGVFSLADDGILLPTDAGSSESKAMIGSQNVSLDELLFSTSFGFISLENLKKRKGVKADAEIIGKKYTDEDGYSYGQETSFSSLNSTLDDWIKGKKQKQQYEDAIEEALKSKGLLWAKSHYISVSSFELYRIQAECVLTYSYDGESTSLVSIHSPLDGVMTEETIKGLLPDQVQKPKTMPEFIQLQKSYYSPTNNIDEEISQIDEKEFAISEEANAATVIAEGLSKIPSMEESLEEQKKEIARLQREIEELEKKKTGLAHQTETLFLDHKSKLHPMVQKCISRFLANPTYRQKIQLFANGLDWAIGASNHNASSEIENAISMVRELGKQLLKVLFDIISGTKEPKLWTYYSDQTTKNNLIRNLKSRGISDESLFDRLVKFHNLCNCYAHIQEDALPGLDNDSTIVNFLALKPQKREEILISPLVVLSTIRMSNQELEAMYSVFSGNSNQ